ncbi:MAG: hypothetical protein HYV09_41085 [Deltaproteobacteria bacterium]|nr:hypothetical protein [Deltaproteobacteria bacterium]
MRRLVAPITAAALLLVGCRTAPPDAPSTSQTAPSAKTAASPGASESPTASAITSAITSAGASSSASAPARSIVVHLVPLGDVPQLDLEVAAAGMRSRAPLSISIEKREPLPDAAKTTEKGRFSADALLTFLQKITAAPGEKVLGVTDVDIVTPKNGVANWGVLGLGALDGKMCVISTFRMRRKWEPGGGAPEALVRERLWKISLHEIGHTLGLPHCPNAGCLMEDAQGTVKTVDSETALCATCRARFGN